MHTPTRVATLPEFTGTPPPAPEHTCELDEMERAKKCLAWIREVVPRDHW